MISFFDIPAGLFPGFLTLNQSLIREHVYLQQLGLACRVLVVSAVLGCEGTRL